MHTVKTFPPEQLKLKSGRLRLDPVGPEDLDMVWDLYKDPNLHTYTPFEFKPNDDVERFRRWTRQQSPDGAETWLNWLTRKDDTSEVVGHVQVGIKGDRNAYIGYVVGRDHQQNGYATESLTLVMDFLKTQGQVRELCAFVDTRNLPSIALVTKLGFKQKEMIKNADHFKGSPSDEFVFSVMLNS
jgi:[ribosomal protein S5]-alanine N-acetyltransferase